MLRDDGSEVRVYHVADGLSKGLRICRSQSSFQDHEHGAVRHSRTAKNLPREMPRSAYDHMQEADHEGRHWIWDESVEGVAGAV
jgi:hypothetical protein